MSQQAIAAKLRCDTATVARHLSVAGVQVKQPRRATPEDEAGTVRRYQAGEPIAKVARAMGSSNGAVRDALVRKGVERRPLRRRPEDPGRDAEILRRYRAGETLVVIGQAVGLSAGSVRAAVDRMGIEPRLFWHRR